MERDEMEGDNEEYCVEWIIFFGLGLARFGKGVL